MFLSEDDCAYMAGKTLVAGLSGGADSMALCHFLAVHRAVYGWELRAAHLNHCLRGEESLRDEAAVEAFCREMGVRLTVCREDVGEKARAEKRSLEDAGREARYALFLREAEQAAGEGKTPLILTAHTLSDDFETALFRLVRGSGMDGLCGIEKERPLGRFTVFRPMLGVTRDEVERYCAENRLPYVTDSSNLSDGYARNRLRLKVVPELKAMNPSVEEAYRRLKENLLADRAYLGAEAEKLLREAEVGAGRWKVSPLREAAGPLRKRALLQVLRASGLPRTAEAAASLDRVVMGEARGFSAGGVRFGCRGGELWREEEAVFSSGAVPLPEMEEGEEQEICFSFQKSLPGRAEPEILRKTVRLRLFPVQKGEETPKVYKNLLYSGIEYATIMNNVVLRARRPGDSIRLPGVGRKAVKKLFQEARLSREERETRLMLAKGSDIVWLEGFGAGEDYRFRGEGVMLGIQAEGLTERTR